MVVKKQAMIGVLTEEQQRELKALEEKIDSAIKKDYTEGEKVFVGLEEWPHKRVIERLERLYRVAGWNIELKSDQKDGDWIEIS